MAHRVTSMSPFRPIMMENIQERYSSHGDKLGLEAVGFGGLCQGVKVDIEPGEGVAFDAFILHVVR